MPEAAQVGLGIVGLLITFLPIVYSIYSQREQVVTRVAFRFGAPPSGARVLERAYQSGLAQQQRAARQRLRIGCSPHTSS